MKYIIIAAMLFPTLAQADGLENAAVYAVDRVTCKLSVPQSWVDAEIVQGMRERSLSYREALDNATLFAEALTNDINESGKVAKWCAYRTDPSSVVVSRHF